MSVSEVILEHVRSSLRGLRGGERSQRVKDLAVHYGVSTASVNRWVIKGGERVRKERRTKGTSKVSAEMATSAGMLLWSSRRASNEIPLPACDAKAILEDSGINTGGLSTSRFLARMREEHVSAADLLRPTPHRRMLSDHPNHVWQFDVTNCLQYFLDKKGLGERDTSMTMYKNKIVKTARTIKRELLRYVIVDHCSGAFFFQYFYATGELAADGSAFLIQAMRPKDELIRKMWPEQPDQYLGKYRMHGVPFMLVADRGSILIAKANQALLDALRVDLQMHLPGNPRAKGAVEGLMHYINRFEARLKYRRPSDVDELNRWALDWCIYANAIPLMRGVAPRSSLWSYITADQLRYCPDTELCHLLIKEPTIERTAGGDRIIKFDGMKYQVPDSQAAGQKVSVVRHPYEAPAVEVHFNGRVWLCQPIPEDKYGRLTNGVPYGEYKGIEYTETQRAAVKMEKQAETLGLTWKGSASHRIAVAPPMGQESPLAVFGHQANKVGNVEFINKQGTPLEIKPADDLPENRPLAMDAAEVSRGIAARRVSVTELLRRLRDEIGVVSPELNRALRERYAAGIEIQEMEEVIRAIQEGAWPAQPEAIAQMG